MPFIYGGTLAELLQKRHLTLSEIRRLENVKLVASDGVFTPEFLQIVGPSVQGVYISSPDFGRFPSSYGALMEKYSNKINMELHLFPITMLMLTTQQI